MARLYIGKEMIGAGSGGYAQVICNTEASTQIKKLNIDGYELNKGAIIGVTFSNGNTFGDCTLATPTYPTLSVNGGTAYPICDSRGHTAGKGFCNAGDYIELRFTGDRFVIMNSDVRQSVKTTTTYYIIYSDNTVELSLRWSCSNYSIPFAFTAISINAQLIWGGAIPYPVNIFSVSGRTIMFRYSDTVRSDIPIYVRILGYI